MLFGPVFSPMLFLIPGISIGFLIKIALGNLKVKNNDYRQMDKKIFKKDNIT
jgi:hypothetical protein